MDQKESLPRAPGICEECLQTKTIRYRLAPVASCYCPHGQTGGLLNLEMPRRMWELFTPVTLEQWVEMLEGASDQFKRLHSAAEKN